MNPEDAELRLLAKGIKRIRRFPPGARCEACGTTEYLAWTADGAIRCYAQQFITEPPPSKGSFLTHFLTH